MNPCRWYWKMSQTSAQTTAQVGNTVIMATRLSYWASILPSPSRLVRAPLHTTVNRPVPIPQLPSPSLALAPISLAHLAHPTTSTLPTTKYT